MASAPPPSRPAKPGSDSGAPGRRRRGRRRRRKSDSTPTAEGRADSSNRGPQVAAPDAPVLPAVSRLAEEGGHAERLTPAEVAEMKEHLGFLRTYKEALRLRLNATEDLLVNGRAEPTNRGVVRHLLGKVDRSVVEAAIAREPLRSTPAARSRMLAGAIRLTADVGVLLTYLETLAHVSSRTEAARVFAEVTRRIDFEALSAARLGRLLQVLTETFDGHERVQVLFSLLDGDAFRRAFDAAAPTLPSESSAACAPLRAVHRRLLEDAEDGDVGDSLATGMRQVLSAPDPVLKGYAEPLRVRMLDLALRPSIPEELADRAAGILLSSLTRESTTYARLAIRRAAQLLSRHADDRARSVLKELAAAQPRHPIAPRWLRALDAPRLGRIALADRRPPHEGLAPGFWLDGQRAVWVRTAPAAARERLDSEARLQAGLALPGVAAVVEHGVAGETPYIAVEGLGRPLATSDARSVGAASALALAACAARLLRAVALAGVSIPDAEMGRFLCVEPGGARLILADLNGARVSQAEAAGSAHAHLALSFLRAVLAPAAFERLPREVGAGLRTALAGAPSLIGLIALLDRAALAAGPEG